MRNSKFWGKKPNRIVIELKDSNIWLGIEKFGIGITLTKNQAFSMASHLQELASGKYDEIKVQR